MQKRGLWSGSCNGHESSLHQLAPYIGKLKTGIVNTLIGHFTEPGQWVCDPFSGVGVVPFEALLMGRRAVASDLSIYAYCVSKGKAEAPFSKEEAVSRASRLLRYIQRHKRDYDLRKVPIWVRKFFHPETLREVLPAFDYCLSHRDWFMAACLCGILHHQRPGFLSYPSSHMVPYLRTNLFPPKQFPELYAYRDLQARLLRKIERSYKHLNSARQWTIDDYDIRRRNAKSLAWGDNSMDLILTSPPYYNALSYARDNRLRLWFLGVKDWRELEKKITPTTGSYEVFMKRCLKEMYRVLKAGHYCVIIVGEVQQGKRTRDTGKILGSIAENATDGGLVLNCTVEDEIPDLRRSRRATKTTRLEKILVLQKQR